MPFQPASDILSNYTVLDLTRVRSGPTCVRQLADWGANVIKIEDPETEKVGLGGPRSGSDFQNLHRNKRSITLNLKTKGGVEILKRLAERADVIVENYRPDVKNRLGIGYDDLKVVNPRLVYASISGFGQDGPGSQHPGFDQIAQGMGGLMSITGEPGRGPMRVGIPIADLTAGIFCSQGILLALMEREKSGKGQWVQTSLLQAQVFMLDFQASRYLMDKDVPGQAGNDHPTSIPTGVFKTKDGHINIAVAGNVMWSKFKGLFADASFDAADFKDGPSRSKNRKALNALIEQHTVKRTSADWIAYFNEQGIPAGPINDIGQVFNDPQVKHRGIAMHLKRPNGQTVPVIRSPLRFSKTPVEHVAPPTVGEHTEKILHEVLGKSDAEIAQLRAAKAI